MQGNPLCNRPLPSLAGPEDHITPVPLEML